ncbi:tRNA-uridine aminocarboxypropyltransferase [Pelomonas aquatica]|jgi:DTW domain-containing protein YfiP|uniref:tRNA-uridine aminocarboxypropyltransferase n=1 Tax=Pelomonas aquatica TaxID=431058 RepID=A0A9X4LKF1_9BURK|nr:tRNA-uridine aminocarboxypropyltransferase [Pelomonas aquatica]MCY4752834.1 DTW domain-containing protein [Pelomonas aquatica]MDG0864469.1 DTW domain-containing protein [Pelomonas aquatica]
MPRAVCPRCERPAATCLCATLPPPVAVRTGLVVLQHPAEAGHAKNTAAFLTLGLSPAARLLRGEVFDTALAGPGTALLYPGAGPPPADVSRLILLDGSWRQSRRLLAANPWLAALPRLSLPPQPSRYAIRRAHRPGQLSTLEAGLHALALLEGIPERFDPLWAAFDEFVRAGLSRRGD